MKKLCLLIGMIVLLLPTEIKAQKKKESIVTIEMYATSGNNNLYSKKNESFIIQTIDNQLNVTDKSFKSNKSNPINAVLEFRKEIDFWASKGYRLLSIETTNKAVETHFYFFATMVKEEEEVR
jgi:hypothetical protein